MKSTLLTLCFLWTASALFAQYVPTPAAQQKQAILLQNATVHIGNGEVIDNADIAFSEGKITFVGKSGTLKDKATHQIIDLKGKHIYPGMIAMNSTLGLNEIGAVRATRDARETGSFNPNVRSIIAYNTDSEVIPTVRANGILIAQISPQGGRLSGQSSAVQLDAWNWEDAVVKVDEGIHLNWPRIFAYSSRWAEPRVLKKNEKYTEQIREMESLFVEAAAYCKNEPSEKNLKLEAMCGLFNQSKKLYIHTNDAKAMEAAVLFAEKHGVTPVIVGGRESWLITDFLREKKVAIVLNSTQSLPQHEDSDIDQPFKTPAQLEAAGLNWCFSHGDYWSQRNLPFTAGQAIGFGLDYEAAVRGLTLSAAKILGIDSDFGSIEEGKSATFIVSEGDVFDMRSSKLIYAFIQGREINLSDKQKVLAEKFSEKYKGE